MSKPVVMDEMLDGHMQSWRDLCYYSFGLASSCMVRHVIVFKIGHADSHVAGSKVHVCSRRNKVHGYWHGRTSRMGCTYGVARQ